MERLFGERVPEAPPIEKEQILPQSTPSNDLMSWMREDECGRGQMVHTAYGSRAVVYADYAASARAFKSIENYLLKEVHPLYGNTHSSVTVTAEQTTLFVHEARQELRAMTGAGDEDSVIFVGNGATAAADLLVHLMDLKGNDESSRLVVVHSIMEHHSNLLPWRNVALECVSVDEDNEGRIDIHKLEETLTQIRSRFPDHSLVGAFTAASNVTGVLNDFESINQCIKRFDGVSIWDFAAAAPYVNVNVNTKNPADAIFFSGHKFPGGVGTPGVVVVKKWLIKSSEPLRKGGGTVFYVDGESTTYLRDPEYREEGGTGDSIGSIRLALAVKLKRSIGEDMIVEKEKNIVQHVLSSFSSIPNLVLLGPPTKEKRLATFSFLIRDDSSGLFFHHNFISALLNDLFGIQTRSGCVCAGPYSQHLLGIHLELSSRFLSLLKESSSLDRLHLRRVGEYSQHEMIRPGFTRISLPYFTTQDEVSFILSAISFIARHSADLLPSYQLNAESGEWHHEKTRVFHDRKWLGHVVFSRKGLEIEKKKKKKSNEDKGEDIMKRAEEEVLKARREMNERSIPDARIALNEEAITLRWFILPIEIWEREVKGMKVEYPQCLIQPRVYTMDEENEQNRMQENVERKTEEITNESEEQCPLWDLVEGEQRGMTVGEDEEGNEEEEELEVEEKHHEDWNRRVIVTRRQMTRKEECCLPWAIPPLEIYKETREVIHSLDMIKNGDRVLVCLSGGKDSLSLLHILHFYQMRNRDRRGIQFDLGAITVDPGSTAYNPRPLIEYCRSLNIDYFYEEQDIIGQARKMKNLRSICAFCSRMKRGRLAAAAVIHGWNVLAMGQHLDDLAESFFIASFQNGNLSTMKAQYTTSNSSLRVIRPLVFVREKALRQFASSSNLPVVAENCPACFNQATERHRMKQMLAAQELLFPDLFCSLRSALRPLLLVDSACTADMRRKAIENIVDGKRKGLGDEE